MLIHYFLHKGHSIKELSNLTTSEFIFMEASMEVDLEMKEEIADMLNKK